MPNDLIEHAVPMFMAIKKRGMETDKSPLPTSSLLFEIVLERARLWKKSVVSPSDSQKKQNLNGESSHSSDENIPQLIDDNAELLIQDDENGFNCIDLCLLFHEDPVGEIKRIISYLPLNILTNAFKDKKYTQLSENIFEENKKLSPLKMFYGQDLRPRRVRGAACWHELIHFNANTGFDDSKREEAETQLKQIVEPYLCFAPLIQYFNNANNAAVIQQQKQHFRDLLNAASPLTKEVIEKQTSDFKRKHTKKGFLSIFDEVEPQQKPYVALLENMAKQYDDNISVKFVNELIKLIDSGNTPVARNNQIFA